MQISFFDGEKPFKFTKPIRLITLFSGYDSQALALKYLGVPFEHYHTCEWAIPSIQALKDLHFDYDNGDYSAGLSKTDLVDILHRKGVSADYNQPLTKEQLNRYGEIKLRTIFNNIVAARNLVSICNVSGNDLEIVDTDKYEYIMTYSFPCQDLSAAGLGKGMERGSGTRSELLWEVERLLKETNELPQVLLMENVKQVIGQKNIGAFADWVSFLDKLGYHSKWKVINATEFGIPQNRERCFMVSVLGNHYYSMPRLDSIQLLRAICNFVDENVLKKYYLEKASIEKITKWNSLQNPLERVIGCKSKCPCLTTRTGAMCGSLILICHDFDDIRNLRGVYEQDKNTKHNLRKLTPRESFRLMGVKNNDYDKIAINQDETIQYHLAGDSIVTTCLMAIFGQMTDIDYESKIEETVKEICSER